MKIPPQVIVGLWLPDGCYYIPFRWRAVPFKSGKGEPGLLPDRTQGAGVSRRLAGEVYGLT